MAPSASRWAHQGRLDAILERWTSRREPAAAVEALQGAGVAAAVVHSGRSLTRDPHLVARDVFDTFDHPKLGKTRVLRPPWRMEGAKVPGPAPRLGQHNEYVLKEMIGPRSRGDRVARRRQRRLVVRHPILNRSVSFQRPTSRW